MTSFAVGTGLGAAGAHQNLLREAAAAALDPATRAAAGARYADMTTLGNRLAFVGPAAGQLLSDADNPRFSEAERAGRAAAQGATVGVGAVGGATAGAALGTLLFPGVGTVAGFALGALGGWGGAVLMDEVNDDAVDRVGEQADDVVPE
jgi:toxin YxiD